ncbi:MAG: glycoside hydrolase family 16 protein [Myxococcales bacterium]
MFEDSFSGHRLDPDKWATRYIYADGNLGTLHDELEDYGDAATHAVDDGVLSLIAQQKQDGSGRYLSGMIRSRQTFYYGYFEARVRLPDARGVWPAFWLNSDYDADGRLNWPPEIDAFEYVINGVEETPDMIHSSVALGRGGVQGGNWIHRDALFDERWKYFRSGEALNTDWQVIGVMWKPESVSMYLNGNRLYTREYHWVYDDGTQAGPAHILLNLAVGGKWAGRHGIDASAFPQRLQVDYVRVCQYDASANASQGCAGSRYAPSATDAAYSTTQNDLPRSRLVNAEISNPRPRVGEKVLVRYTFDAQPTPSDHWLRTTLVSSNGTDVATVAASPPVPTSKWHHLQRLTQTLLVPQGSKGRFRVLVSIGSHVSGEKWERRLSFGAARRFGNPDGKLRYAVGELVVE